MMVVEGLREGGTGGGTNALLVERLWHRVAASTLARNLRPEVLRRLFAAMELVSFPAGATLAAAGEGEDDGGRLLFLLDGVVRAYPAGETDEGSVARDFGPGDVLGESVLLERRPWPADYRTETGAKALALDRAGLEKTLVGNPDPRGFLTALRMQHHDRDLVKFLHEIGKKPDG